MSRMFDEPDFRPTRVAGDDRCRLLHGDVFALAHDPAAGFGPARLSARLLLPVVFALWSNDPPDHAALDDLHGIFAAA